MSEPLAAAAQAQNARAAQEEAHRLFDRVPEANTKLVRAALELCRWALEEEATAIGRVLKELE